MASCLVVSDYAASCQDVRWCLKPGCRDLPGDDGLFRDIRANMEQTAKLHGLDHYGWIITISRVLVCGCSRTGVREPPWRWTRSVTPAEPARTGVVLVLTIHVPAIVLLLPVEAGSPHW
jgi:hypothetical protein